jgi:hypothetical protein
VPVPFHQNRDRAGGQCPLLLPDLVPTVIGNIENESATEAINSEQARKIRASILDGSYRYCNAVRYNQTIRDQIPSKTDPDLVNDPMLGRVLREQDASLSEIRVQFELPVLPARDDHRQANAVAPSLGTSRAAYCSIASEIAPTLHQ